MIEQIINLLAVVNFHHIVIVYIIMFINYDKILLLISKRITNIVKNILNNNNDLKLWVIPKLYNYLFNININDNFSKLLKEHKMTKRIVALRINNNNNIELITGYKNNYDETITSNIKCITKTELKLNFLGSNKYINKWRLGNWQVNDCYSATVMNKWLKYNFLKNDLTNNFEAISYNKDQVFNKKTKKVAFNNFKINDMPIIIHNNYKYVLDVLSFYNNNINNQN